MYEGIFNQTQQKWLKEGYPYEMYTFNMWHEVACSMITYNVYMYIIELLLVLVYKAVSIHKAIYYLDFYIVSLLHKTIHAHVYTLLHKTIRAYYTNCYLRLYIYNCYIRRYMHTFMSCLTVFT